MGIAKTNHGYRNNNNKKTAPSLFIINSWHQLFSMVPVFLLVLQLACWSMKSQGKDHILTGIHNVLFIPLGKISDSESPNKTTLHLSKTHMVKEYDHDVKYKLALTHIQRAMHTVNHMFHMNYFISIMNLLKIQ